MLNLDLRTIVKVVDGEVVCPDSIDKESILDSCIKGAEINSQKILPGFIFVAEMGARDGHDFIGGAFDNGALAAICERIPEAAKEKGLCIVVPDSKRAIEKVAKYYRELFGDALKVVNITGSVGKTSTKEFVANVVSQKYVTHKTVGNRNSITGFPFEMLSIEEGTEVAVLELGIDRRDEMDRLSAIAMPDIAAITNIGPCHLENLGSLDGVLEEKSKVFNSLKAGGYAILNGNDEKMSKLSDIKNHKTYRYGRNTDNVYVSKIKKMNLYGSEILIHTSIDGKEEDIDVKINIPGKHMIANALTATLIGKLLDIDNEKIKAGIEATMPMAQRSSIVKTDKYEIIDDCYNANAMSMKAAVDMLVLGEGRKVAIFGDMFDLGADSEKLHEEVGRYVADNHIELMIFVGDAAAYMRDGARAAIVCEGQDIRYYSKKEELIANIDSLLRDGDTVLVKASRGMHFEEIVEKIKQ